MTAVALRHCSARDGADKKGLGLTPPRQGADGLRRFILMVRCPILSVRPFTAGPTEPKVSPPRHDDIARRPTETLEMMGRWPIGLLFGLTRIKRGSTEISPLVNQPTG
ncbi:hypothetical protein SEVIR_9G147850v4 [Setaria viridis]